MSPVVKLFGAVLKLYPPEYRRRVAADALATFAQMHADAAGRGARASVALAGFGGALRGIGPAWWDALRDSWDGLKGGGGIMGGATTLRVRLRRLMREPAFTVSVLVLLTLGIGSATAIVTVADTVLFAPLPYPEPDRLVFLENGAHSVPDVAAWRERIGPFEEVAGARPGEATVSGSDQTVRAVVVRATEGFLGGLGATTSTGRLLTTRDFDEQSRVAVLDHGFWVRTLGSDPGVVGRTLDVDGVGYEVVGVLSSDFTPPERIVGDNADLWVPILRSDGVLVDPNSRALAAFARLRPGATLGQAQSEMDRVMASLAVELPEYHRDEEGVALEVPLTLLSDAVVASVRVPLLVLLGAAGLLLLATCANAAGLFLARGVSRRGEWSVRMALGAEAWAVVADVVVEALVLVAVGTALGLLLAKGALDLMVGLQPGLLPRASEIGIGPRTFLYAAGISLLTALVFGALPAIRATGAAAAGVLRTARSGPGRGESRLQSALVSAQVGLTTVLLLGGGLLTRSLMELTSVDLGMDTENAIYASVPLGRETPPSERIRIIRELRAGIGAVPGVRSVGGGMTSPLQYSGAGRCCWGTSPIVDGVEHPGMIGDPVTEGYFESLGIRMVSGRGFTELDIQATPVPVILNETGARDLFGAGEAVGRSLELPLRGPTPTPAIVIGVAPDVRHWGPTEEAEPFFYVPWESYGSWASRFGMAVRVGSLDPSTMGAVREAAQNAVPSLALDIMPYSHLARETVARPRFFATLIGLFAGAALLIAAGGLFATLLYHVRQRRRDVGIRLALGADGGRVAREVMRRGGLTVLGGVLVGAACLPLATRGLQTLLFDVGASDPRTLLGVLGVLVVTTVVATYLPARLAARTDPVTVLKNE